MSCPGPGPVLSGPTAPFSRGQPGGLCSEKSPFLGLQPPTRFVLQMLLVVVTVQKSKPRLNTRHEAGRSHAERAVCGQGTRAKSCASGVRGGEGPRCELWTRGSAGTGVPNLTSLSRFSMKAQ